MLICRTVHDKFSIVSLALGSHLYALGPTDPAPTPGARSVGPCAGDKQRAVECTKGCDKHRPAIVVVTTGVYQGIARLAQHHASFFSQCTRPYVFFRKRPEKNANWKGSGDGGLSGRRFRVRRFFLTMHPPYNVSFYGGFLRGVGALLRGQ